MDHVNFIDVNTPQIMWYILIGNTSVVGWMIAKIKNLSWLTQLPQMACSVLEYKAITYIHNFDNLWQGRVSDATVTIPKSPLYNRASSSPTNNSYLANPKFGCPQLEWIDWNYLRSEFMRIGYFSYVTHSHSDSRR